MSAKILSYRGRSTWLLVTLACVLGCARSADEAGEPKVALSLQYVVGDTLRYEYTAQGTATYPATDEEEERTTEYERRLSVEEVATDVAPNGNYLITWIYHLPERKRVTETSTEELPPRDVAIDLEITSQGRIVDVANIETAKSLFGDMDFRTYLEQTQPVFPERPLEVGDSWTQHVRVLSPDAEPVVTTSNYVLDSVVEMDGESIAVIAFDGDVYLPRVFKEGGEREVGASEERIKVRGKMYFAHERGVTREVEIEANAEIIQVGAENGEIQRRALRFQQMSSLRLVE